MSYKFALSVTLVIGLLVAIGALALSTVTTMRDATNELDERRLVNAVSAAMSSVKKRLAGTVRDNAVWDDAYEAVRSGDPVAWIEDNWGAVSADYPLYDGVIVLGPDGAQIAAYRKGQPIDAVALFGPGIVKRSLVASRLENIRTVFDLYQIDGSIVVTATLGIRPVNDPDLDTAHTTLTFFKTLTPGFVGAIAEEFQINALRIQASPDPGQSWRLITNFEGEPLGYFVWPKTDPGTAVYNTALPTLIALGGLLLALILIVISAFRFELKKESDLAVKAIHDATHDHLTGLYNRAGMIAAIDRAPAGSIFHLIDLDGFKGVNDVWGHATGDRLLRAIAETLTKTTSEAFAIGRFGGDEFALLHAGERDPSHIGNTIVHVLAQPFLIDGHHVEIGASIGYAGVVDGHDALETVHRADLALYCAKDAGRGQVQSYTAELDAQRKSLFALEEKLRTAIDSDEIHVVFQPLVCTRSGRTKGVEALARWSPATGPVSPCVFIPLAEKAGLIERLSMNVLEAALISLAVFPELDLSVNISPVQLANPRFALEIEKVLEKHSFSASRLILEVTEGALISHPERACRSMTALRAKGVRFAMDDFGSGHASIGTLRQFAFDKVKIDRSLIASDEHAVVRATIDLANALGIPVTAEGIETAEQAAFARGAGCELLQGYLLGRPMAFPALVEHLTGATDEVRSA
ncbi:bifunctional diguanylate cyclase/phosphodiesterase [Rhizobium sp. RU20A]|uniref:putative bifunctional diguanylate cyclase/phosphodiesterase n=1 Tax=Rhizobium sp. RU20A TaxID=1907412 RepID=UPI00122CCEA3|nr:bifunctional diguanylate cyclase/phosphodiesterase [Rhizobium sp. RU20A]